MKITYVAHACLLIEVAGLKILTDPWIVGPSWGGNLWVYPPAKVSPEQFHDIDFIYFSHAHEDHFQMESIGKLPEQTRARATVLIPKFDLNYFERWVRDAGFQNVTVMVHEETRELALGARAHMLINDVGDHDSAMVLEADESTVFLQTDSIVSLVEAERIGDKFDIDLAFVITAQTGIFPAFCDLPAADMIEQARKKHQRSVDYAIGVTARLRTRCVIPYASDLCYLGELFPVNALHGHDKNQFVGAVAKRLPGVQSLLMSADDSLCLERGEVMDPIVSDPPRGPEMLATFALQMQERYDQARRLELRRTTPELGKLCKLMQAALTQLSVNWQHPPYRVMWRIADADGTRSVIGHTTGGTAQKVDQEWPYDLRIDVPAFRLRRLAHGDYPMGFLTLQNGSIRFHRHAMELTRAERDYWHSLLKLRIQDGA